MSNAHFYLPIDIGLSLKYHIKENSFSLINNLYNGKQIDKLRFIIHNPRIKINGHLYIRSVPDNNHILLQNRGTVKIGQSLPTWGFNLTSITVILIN